MTEFEKFKYGELAQRFLGSEESAKFVDGALLVLGKDLGLGDDAEGFIEGALASEEGTAKAAEIYSTSFNKGFNTQDASKMDWYNGTLAGLSSEEQDKFKKVFSDQSGKTYQKIQEEFSKAAYTIRAPKGMFSDTDNDGPKKTVEKYQKFLGVKENLDDYVFEGLRGKAVDASRKRNLKDLSSKL